MFGLTPHYYFFNQKDNYMEEALKMRNLLQEFLKKNGVRNPTILGLREHIFTGRYGDGPF